MNEDALNNKIKETQQEYHNLQEQKKNFLLSLQSLDVEEKQISQKFREILTHNIFIGKQYIQSSPLYFGPLKEITPLTITNAKYTAFLRQEPEHFDYIISYDFQSIHFADLSSVFNLISQFQNIDNLLQKNPYEFNNFFKPGKYIILKSFTEAKKISKFVIIKMS